ncbi:F-box only protein 6-like [Trichogramma pretiosum]|uniref:F-box only protein 6-like n=1 Tax=Trichogramma pretiosum TaxID=7493 RepID=UPI0006C97BCA|nr:F-box only protein 6-like [Trichogramma pretiosum]
MGSVMKTEIRETVGENGENGENGLVFNFEHYIPQELVSDIFTYLDIESLVACQQVCRTWKSLIQSYVWRKKAEQKLRQALPHDEEASWIMYYKICKQRPLKRNLIKNPCGNNGFRHWKILSNGGDRWTTESPPTGIPPLPTDLNVLTEDSCFVTSYGPCWASQEIDLIKEGCTEYLLDNIQPVIKIREWYGCRWDCKAVYYNSIELLEDENIFDVSIVKAKKKFKDTLWHEKQNKWFKFEHVFKDYGPGLRKIVFNHGGQDSQFWAGHFGSKMTRASIILEIPETYSGKNDLDNSTQEAED